MARYIDADKLIAHLKDEIKECEIPSGSRANGKGIAYGTALGLRSAISFAETLSTADVVPKREVDEIVRQWKEEANCWQNNYIAELRNNEQIEKKVAREIFEEIDSIFRKYYEICSQTDLKLLEPILQGERFIINEMWHEVAELKKKYTEGENEDQRGSN